MTGQPLEINADIRCEKNVNDVIISVPWMRLDFVDMLRALDQAFCEQKTGRKFCVVPRRAHRDAQRMVIDPNFQWFFGSQGIQMRPGTFALLPS